MSDRDTSDLGAWIALFLLFVIAMVALRAAVVMERIADALEAAR